MGTISLEGLEFFAYHGFYDEEQKIGNKYAVDIHLSVDLKKAGSSDILLDTVNYERVYKIAAAVMQEKAKLLEHIAFSLIGHLRHEFPAITGVMVKVSKFNPPIGGVCKCASVTLEG